MNVIIIPSWYINPYKPALGSFFREQAVALAAVGIQITILYLHQYRLADAIKQRRLLLGMTKSRSRWLTEYIFHFPKIPKCPPLDRFIAAFINRFVFLPIAKAIRPDIMHLHSSRSGSTALFLKRQLGIPFVTTEHSSFFARNKFSRRELSLARRVFLASSANFAVSLALSDMLSRRFDVPFSYFPNFIADSFFTPLPPASVFDHDFITIGFLKPVKNQALLIRAFARAFGESSSVRLSIVGSGPERNRLQELIESLNLSGRVLLLGYRTRDEIKDLLAHSRAFVLSSVYETFNVAVIEALAAGRPVVATRCGGPESTVTSNLVGLLCDQDEASLAAALRHCLETAYDSEAIRQYAFSNFSSSVAVEKLRRVYKDIAGGS